MIIDTRAALAVVHCASGLCYRGVPSSDTRRQKRRVVPDEIVPIALVVFGCSFGAALIGMVLHVKLPDNIWTRIPGMS